MFHRYHHPPSYRQEYAAGCRTFPDARHFAMLNKRVRADGIRKNGVEFPMETDRNRDTARRRILFQQFYTGYSPRKRRERKAGADKRKKAEQGPRQNRSSSALMSHELRTRSTRVIGITHCCRKINRGKTSRKICARCSFRGE